MAESSLQQKNDRSFLFSITQKQIVTAQTASGPVKVLSGFFRGIHGMIPPHIRTSLYDITLNPGRRLSLSTRETDTADHVIPEKSAVLFGSGSQIQLQAPSGHQTRILYASAPPLNEPIAWGGPIVMNTSDEIRSAFQELRTGQFIRHSAHIIQ
jgi:redox-sensitive bicupin YhaK (pirin superfamily)